MISPDKIVHNFLEDYGKALSAGDLPAIVNSWDVPALVLSDQGARMVSEAGEVEQFFAGAIEWYKAQGKVVTRPGAVEIKRLSDRLVSVDVIWSVLDSNGTEIPGEHSYYILNISDDGQPRIQVAIALTPVQ
jgi:hypothetical protein